jgi:nucleoid-associated protein YgaU
MENLVIDHNVETGEIIEREASEQELAQREADDAAFAAVKAETEAKEAARQALLDKLGITADEARLLLG